MRALFKAVQAILALGWRSDAHASPPQSLPPVELSSLPTCDMLPSAIICEDWSSGRIRHELWQHEISATGGGNGEFQLYSQHPQNSFVANGTLHIRPSFSYNHFGDLRDALDLRAYGCTSDWNNGCHKPGTLHAEAGNPGGKLWTASVTTPADMPAIREAITAAGLPMCETHPSGICNTMVPVGGLRQSPIMSAKLSSKTSFKYGRVEITATLPRGHSLWPALWMLPTGQAPWPTGGEIDIMESMGSTSDEGFALDHRSTSSAVHFGERDSWYDLAYTPSYEELKGLPFGALSLRRALADGPHTFGLYWAEDNLYMYVDDDANRVLDMDDVFRLTARNVLDDWRPAAAGGVSAERRTLAEEIAEKGYRAGWRKFSVLCGKTVPEWLWPPPSEGGADGAAPADGAPFDRPFHLIMNLAVGGNFFKGNLNPKSDQRAMWDHPIGLTGQLPSMYWYSRMKEWWASWAKPGSSQHPTAGDGEAHAASSRRLHPAFQSASTHPAAFLQTANTWNEYANGGQDAGSPDAHKADALAAVPPPADDAIGDHVALKVHRVIVMPVVGSEVVAAAPAAVAAEEHKEGKCAADAQV